MATESVEVEASGSMEPMVVDEEFKQKKRMRYHGVLLVSLNGKA